VSELIALYDSCVLYPAPLRDLLVHLGAIGLVHAKWTQRIHDEWMDALLINRPDLSRDRLQRTRDLMDRAVLDCLVEGYETLATNLVLPDPDDRQSGASLHRGPQATVEPQESAQVGCGVPGGLDCTRLAPVRRSAAIARRPPGVAPRIRL
jgi:hypothetical protein